MPFQRSYQQNWTSEIFRIKSRFLLQGIPMYKIKDFHNLAVKGNFYTSEMLPVNKDINSTWYAEKNLRKRKRNGKVQWLVKFEGWPNTYNQWLNESEISLQANNQS